MKKSEKSDLEVDQHLTFAFYGNKFPNDNRFINDACRMIFDRLSKLLFRSVLWSHLSNKFQ